MEKLDLQAPYLMIVSPQKFHHRFSKEEDEKILTLVNNCENKEFINWRSIASKLKDRTPRQCRERYLNYLKGKNKKGDWTKEEDELIMSLYNQIGPKWAKMTEHFNKRSNIDIKNTYSILKRRIEIIYNQESSIKPGIYQQPNNLRQSPSSYNYIIQNQNIQNNNLLLNDCNFITMTDRMFIINTLSNQDMIHFRLE